MRDVVLDDNLIKDFARNELLRQGDASIRRPTAFNPIRQKLRALANCVSQANSLDPGIESMTHLISPKKFNVFIKVCTNIANTNNQMGLTIGGYIKKIVLLKISTAIVEDSSNMQREAEQFRYLFDAHFTSQVSAVARKKQRLKRIDMPEDLPLFEDMQVLGTYIKKQISQIAKNETVRLSKLILAYLVMYNKRRPFEVAEIERDTYIRQAYKSVQDNKEILASLSYAERLMATRSVESAIK